MSPIEFVLFFAICSLVQSMRLNVAKRSSNIHEQTLALIECDIVCPNLLPCLISIYQFRIESRVSCRKNAIRSIWYYGSDVKIHNEPGGGLDFTVTLNPDSFCHYLQSMEPGFDFTIETIVIGAIKFQLGNNQERVYIVQPRIEITPQFFDKYVSNESKSAFLRRYQNYTNEKSLREIAPSVLPTNHELDSWNVSF